MRPAHDPPRAAPADSSLYASPTGGSRYHVVAEGGIAICGQPTFLNDDHQIRLQLVSKVLRCRRAGCKKYFDQVDDPCR